MTEASQAKGPADALQEEAKRLAQGLATWVEEFVIEPAAPPLGVTPREEVLRRGKARLYRYRPQRKRLYPVPFVIIPWVGISRTYILDLLPGNSFIEHLVKHGHDVYLLDWGMPGEEDREFGFEECVFDILPRVVERAREVSGAKEITLNGNCLGGTLTASYLALNPDAPVRNFVAVVAPIDSDHGGLFKAWLTEDFPADQLVRVYGMVPTHLMGTGFKMLRPLGDAAAVSALWFNLARRDYVTLYKAMSRWANEYIPMPGRFFLQLARDIYAKNKLAKGEFVVGGQRVDLSKIVQPLLVVAAKQDHIVPPLAARALIDLVSSEDKEYVELPGGHISVFAGRTANVNLWPKIAQWVAQRSRRNRQV